MKGSVKVLVVLVMVLGISSFAAAGAVVDDFDSSTPLGNFGWAIQGTGGNGAPSATLTSGGGTLDYSLTITQPISAGQSAYSYAFATVYALWVPNYLDYQGFLVDVASRSTGLIWNFTPAYAPGILTPEYEPLTSFSWVYPNDHTDVRLTVSVQGPAAPGTYTLALDSLQVGNPWDIDVSGIRVDVDINTSDIDAIYGLLDSDADGDLTDETVGLTAAQEATLNAADGAINDEGGILDRLAAIEEALSKPGASGVARFGK